MCHQKVAELKCCLGHRRQFNSESPEHVRCLREDVHHIKQNSAKEHNHSYERGDESTFKIFLEFGTTLKKLCGCPVDFTHVTAFRSKPQHERGEFPKNILISKENLLGVGSLF